MKKIETKSTVLLKHHLKALRLPTMTAECEKVAARCAAEDVDHLGFLLQLCELELIERDRRAAGEPAAGRRAGHGQDPPGHRPGRRGVRPGQAGPLLPGDPAGDAAAGGP